MRFYEIYKQYKEFDYDGFFASLSDRAIHTALNKPKKSEIDLLALLSPKAGQDHLEAMAQKSNELTIRNFGKTILMFTPLYLANYCENACIYCGFNRTNHISRSRLTMEEVEREGAAIQAMGVRHIIILTGESRAVTPPSYIADCARILRKYVSSICIEVYSLTQEEYEMLYEAGVDSFTMFQETYNEDIYPILHPSGPKHDYRTRLDSPEKACIAQYRSVNIGALLGLDEWRREVFYTALHAKYLTDRYPGTDIAVSLPRIRPCAGEGTFHPKCEVDDRAIVQAMTALRLFLPRLGITASTREPPEFRDHLIGLGVTKMSAGSVTEVGGHAESPKTEGQFEISDPRSVPEMAEAIHRHGYQCVYKDWDEI